jgi:hypothetical protein
MRDYLHRLVRPGRDVIADHRVHAKGSPSWLGRTGTVGVGDDGCRAAGTRRRPSHGRRPSIEVLSSAVLPRRDRSPAIWLLRRKAPNPAPGGRVGIDAEPLPGSQHLDAARSETSAWARSVTRLKPRDELFMTARSPQAQVRVNLGPERTHQRRAPPASGPGRASTHHMDSPGAPVAAPVGSAVDPAQDDLPHRHQARRRRSGPAGGRAAVSLALARARPQQLSDPARHRREDRAALQAISEGDERVPRPLRR